ncbi:PAS domain S-box-containing protein [Catalinimonas alkaloidigena]|uniref:PAS domain-containing sensor histidine kinase n=1 Tax=Catalinimonas alkaloidigena TaxID=1075417 RepID=UPI0024059D73|nr:PAS domain-containing sensor histidine kinase [Catalinimonas alkaloidigena]MDF9800355.1 PAS domain S-box-containing protein [Catalinimonas alkaloidigena]
MDQTAYLEEPYKESSKQYLTYLKDKFNDSGQTLLPKIHQIPLAVCVSSEEGILEQVNDAYCALYQYSSDELLGQHFTIVVPEASKTKLVQLHENFMTQKHEMADEWEVQRRDGSLITVYANAAYVVMDGAPKKVTFVVDISDTKKTERELKETISKLNALVTSQEHAMELLLHDLRGPVGNILSLSELMLDERFTSEQQTEITKRLQQSAQRAFDLTNRLYGIVQIESDQYSPNPAVFDLHKMLGDVWADLSILVETKKLALRTKKDAACQQELMLSSDAFLFNIIFYNLLKNAVEASPKSEQISVELKQVDRCLHITIHNQGEIPPEVQQNFFQKYITSGKAKGTGLGTYLVKKSVALLQGDISFSSTAEEGTSLYLQFPISIVNKNEEY